MNYVQILDEFDTNFQSKTSVYYSAMASLDSCGGHTVPALVTPVKSYAIFVFVHEILEVYQNSKCVYPRYQFFFQLQRFEMASIC